MTTNCISFNEGSFDRSRYFRGESLTATQLKNIREWQVELRSGTYKQGTNALRDNNKYCCLGVLCQVNDLLVPTYPGSDEFRFKTFDGCYNMLDYETMLELTGLELSFWDLNDTWGYSFSDIADFIDLVIEGVPII